MRRVIKRDDDLKLIVEIQWRNCKRHAEWARDGEQAYNMSCYSYAAETSCAAIERRLVVGKANLQAEAGRMLDRCSQ